MVISIRGGKYWLWRAVDNEGEVLDFLVQRRRDAQAAKKLMVKLLKKHGFAPSRVVTDRLRSYPAALRAIGLTAEHDRRLRANNRAENSHQPIRRRERKLQRFKSPGSAQRFLAVHAATFNAFTHQRHLLRRPHFKELRAGSFGPGHPPPHDACCPLRSPQLNADNVTKPVEEATSPVDREGANPDAEDAAAPDLSLDLASSERDHL
jgi:IS1 family transposase